MDLKSYVSPVLLEMLPNIFTKVLGLFLWLGSFFSDEEHGVSPFRSLYIRSKYFLIFDFKKKMVFCLEASLYVGKDNLKLVNYFM